MSAGRPSLWSVVHAFGATLWRQTTRDRMVLFVTVVLPVLIIVIIGTTTGGRRSITVAVTGDDGDVLERVVSGLDSAAGVDVERVEDVAEMEQAIRRFDVDVGIIVPSDADAVVAAGHPVEVSYLADETSNDAFAARSIVEGVLDRAGGPLAAAAFAAEITGVPFDQARAAVDAGVSDGSAVVITTEQIGSADFEADSPFSLTTAQNLVLFSFITALTSAGLIVVARRNGVLRRTLSTPAGVWSVMIGLGTGWFILSAGQGALIMLIGRVVFGVEWGDPLGAVALLTFFAAVGCGAGLLVGALFRQEDQVGSMTPPLGIILGALGGCMVPSEIFPPAVLAISKFTPHYWALEGWKSQVFQGGDIGDLGQELGVLFLYGVILVGAAVTILRRRLVSTD